jgi:hypothetical protein
MLHIKAEKSFIWRSFEAKQSFFSAFLKTLLKLLLKAWKSKQKFHNKLTKPPLNLRKTLQTKLKKVHKFQKSFQQNFVVEVINMFSIFYKFYNATKLKFSQRKAKNTLEFLPKLFFSVLLKSQKSMKSFFYSTR